MNSAAVRMISSDRASHSWLVCPHAVMPCPPSTTPIACGLAAAMAAMSSPSWKPGRRQGTHATRSPKHCGGQLLPVRRGGQRDPGVGVQMVHVRRVDQPVHRGVDRRRGAPFAVQAEVERRDHLVLPVHPGIDVDQRPQPVKAQHRQARGPQRAQVTARALDPHQLDVLAGHRVGRGALGRGVAPGVVRVPRVRAQPVRPCDQLIDNVTAHAPHPAGAPPVRSATIFSAYPDR